MKWQATFDEFSLPKNFCETDERQRLVLLVEDFQTWKINGRDSFMCEFYKNSRSESGRGVSNLWYKISLILSKTWMVFKEIVVFCEFRNKLKKHSVKLFQWYQKFCKFPAFSLEYQKFFLITRTSMVTKYHFYIKNLFLDRQTTWRKSFLFTSSLEVLIFLKLCPIFVGPTLWHMQPNDTSMYGLKHKQLQGHRKIWKSAVPVVMWWA